MGLIPGLPDELAKECLARVPYTSLYKISFVCNAWNNLLTDPAFFLRRTTLKTSEQAIILLVKITSNPNEARSLCSVVIFDPAHNQWGFLPPIPSEFQVQYSDHSQCCYTNNKLAVMGFKNQQNKEKIRSVLIYDFQTWKWRRGADMPMWPSLFIMASNSGKVSIGGELESGITTAEYSIEQNQWTVGLSPERKRSMERETIGTSMQGRMGKVWEEEEKMNPCVHACKGVFKFRRREVWGFEENELADTLPPVRYCFSYPRGMRVRCVASWEGESERGNIFVCGCDENGNNGLFFLFTPSIQRGVRAEWRAIDRNEGIAWKVFAACLFKQP